MDDSIVLGADPSGRPGADHRPRYPFEALSAAVIAIAGWAFTSALIVYVARVVATGGGAIA
jgi:hypothetical protein